MVTKERLMSITGRAFHKRGRQWTGVPVQVTGVKKVIKFIMSRGSVSCNIVGDVEVSCMRLK